MTNKGYFMVTIYEALKADHEEVRDLLNDLIALEVNDDYRNVLIDQIRNALIPHSRAEESVFYNAIRAVSPDKSEIMHAFKEHAEAEALLRSLQVMDKMDLSWKSTAEKLLLALERHIQDEETEIFDLAKKIFTEEEATSIGQAFQKLKAEVQKQGFMGTSMDFVVNLLPPRLAEKIRNLSTKSQNGQVS